MLKNYFDCWKFSSLKNYAELTFYDWKKHDFEPNWLKKHIDKWQPSRKVVLYEVLINRYFELEKGAISSKEFDSYSNEMEVQFNNIHEAYDEAKLTVHSSVSCGICKKWISTIVYVNQDREASNYFESKGWIYEKGMWVCPDCAKTLSEEYDRSSRFVIYLSSDRELSDAKFSNGYYSGYFDKPFGLFGAFIFGNSVPVTDSKITAQTKIFKNRKQAERLAVKISLQSGLALSWKVKRISVHHC